MQQAFRNGEVPAQGMSPSERANLLGHMERGLALFLPPAKRDAALAELRGVLERDESAAMSVVTFEILLESDITKVRSEARRISN